MLASCTTPKRRSRRFPPPLPPGRAGIMTDDGAHLLLNLAGPCERGGRRFRFTPEKAWVVGRGADCDVGLDGDAEMSRRHCEFRWTGAEWRVRDLGSANGTEVRSSGDRGGEGRSTAAGDGVPLRPGDEIRVSRHVFRVEAVVSPGGDPTTGDLPGGDGAERGPAGGPRYRGYRTLRPLGEGRFASVWLVVRDEDSRTLALKVIKRDRHVSPYALAAFLREAGTLRALRHPNIVGLEEAGETDDDRATCLVMEYCAAGSLEELLQARGGRLSVSEAGPLFLEVLDGMAEAHRRGIVHRDIKPGNILLQPAGPRLQAKVGDLGLAKSFVEAGMSGITRSGMSAGTPQYMPREQLADFKYLPPAGDVWSLAATFYRMLTGSVPREFGDGCDPVGVVLEQPPIPIRQRDPSIPRALAEIIDRALSQKPEQRYADAGAFRQLLGRALGG